MRLYEMPLLIRKLSIYKFHLTYNGHLPEIKEAMEKKIEEIKRKYKEKEVISWLPNMNDYNGYTN